MSSQTQPHPVRAIEIIGAASALGAPVAGCERAPEHLRAIGLTERLRSLGLQARWQTTLHPATPAPEGIEVSLAEFCTRLGRAVAGSIARRALPLVVGGDHSIALGTWSGARQATGGALGLIWVDAHLDAHTPRTSPSGALHGMPLALLLGHGDERLASATVAPHNVCVVGMRSFEAEEARLLERLGVTVIGADALRTAPVAAAQQALRVARDGTRAFGLSLDLDVIDPGEAPGVGTPAAGGPSGAAVAEFLAAVCAAPGLAAVEIAELNPGRDEDGASADLVLHLAAAALAAQARLDDWIGIERRHGARNYDTLPVVLTRGEGVHLFDLRGRRYIDMMSAYSAASFGHAHPLLLAALGEQAARLAMTSRAFHNDRLPLLLRRLCALTGLDRALPLNTGLEAVETALKAARKWAYRVKGVPAGQARIVACEGNFHGRSIAILAMSTEARYRDGFDPFPAGFDCVPYGDAAALARAITPYTAAFLVEPIQGEGGIRVPPPGYLAECARICREANVLLICDEVQTGLGRTGALFACQHDGVAPDAIVLGKALGGGLLPVSAVVGREDLMAVFAPGEHGSTFGGNPLACAVALAALDLLEQAELPRRAAELGRHLMSQLAALRSPAIREVRGRGLMVGVELDPALADARLLCRRLMEHGVLTRETHGTVLRLSPPLTISRRELDEALRAIAATFAELGLDARHGGGL
jgi:ornithine--oxo-acid transaminase